jgi:DNA-binding NarL/FixJ family response regulator
MTSNAAVPPRAVLADDERLMREQMRARLAEAWPELQVVAEAKNGLEAVAAVREHRPDIAATLAGHSIEVMFLDLG